MSGGIKKNLNAVTVLILYSLSIKAIIESKSVGIIEVEYWITWQCISSVGMIECCVVLSDAAPGGLKKLMDLQGAR